MKVHILQILIRRFRRLHRLKKNLCILRHGPAGGRSRALTTSLLILLLLSLPVLPVALQAQEPVTIESLTVDLWPDYDRASVLVLLTGALSADTALPAIVTVPLPPGAALNAVARITVDNTMIDDIPFTEAADAVTFTTPDPRFRVEFYEPYTAEGLNRAFTYTWQTAVSVEQLEVTVQQPAAAGSLTVTPAAAAIFEGSSDGLSYYSLPVTRVATGDTYVVSVEYTMSTPQLTAALLQQAAPAAQETAVSPGSDDGFNWPMLLIILGSVMIAGVLLWQLAGASRQRRPRRKPAVRRAAKPTKRPPRASRPAKFCHECGTAVSSGDKFCRSCGTAVKQ